MRDEVKLQAPASSGTSTPIGRSHPAADELWATRMGDSIGPWEGDTLIGDTVAMKPRLVLYTFFALR